MKKGQTATEYLIILAVVIIIALIVVGVMGGIPGLGNDPNAPKQSDVAKWVCEIHDMDFVTQWGYGAECMDVVNNGIYNVTFKVQIKFDWDEASAEYLAEVGEVG